MSGLKRSKGLKSLDKRREEMMYVAYRPCGCVKGFTVVGKDSCKKSAAKYVSMWVKDGWEIQTKSDD